MATRRIPTRRTGRAAAPRDHHTPNRRHTGPVLTALVLIAACAPGDPHGSGASDEPGWPGEEWPVSTPEAEGVDPAAIDALVADIDAGRYGLIDHLLLIRHGRVIADHHWDHGEAYAELLAAQEDTVDHQFNYDHPSWHPLYRDTHLHSLQSVTKSVLSVAFGIAVDAGHIPGVDAPAWPYFEAHGADLSDPRRAGTSLEDFLTMRSGIDWAIPGETYDDDTHPTVVLEASDAWIDYVVGRPVGTDPGTRFDYNDGVSVLLGKIVREATGQRLDLWARQHLFEPVGIDDFYWKVTPGGEIDSEGGLYLSTHDLARIGYLMLRGGVWDGRQIVSREWVQASTSPVVPDVNPDNDRADTGYGYQWWVPLHEDGKATVFAANGYGGQFLHVIPEYDLITVFNGWTLHESPELSSWVAWRDRILPAVSAEAPGSS
ncbi:MAG: serine hydrolase [Gemmatimonadetes bacterium]|nr:serine hydrolase [Gemmatimonadota bacterium]